MQETVSFLHGNQFSGFSVADWNPQGGLCPPEENF